MAFSVDSAVEGGVEPLDESCVEVGSPVAFSQQTPRFSGVVLITSIAEFSLIIHRIYLNHNKMLIII